MKEKLTLSIKKETIEKSKKLARLKRTSLSRMVEQFLDESTQEMADWKPQKGSITERITGCIRIEPEKDYRELIEQARLEKYGYGKNSD